MCTLADKFLKHALGHLFASIGLAVFGAVYECFSHEVYSYYMIYAFAIPLCMGALPYSIMTLKRKKPDGIFLNLWNSAIAAFTTGSIFYGILAIYGTTNQLVIVYPITGGILTLTALCRIIRKSVKNRKKAVSIHKKFTNNCY